MKRIFSILAFFISVSTFAQPVVGSDTKIHHSNGDSTIVLSNEITIRTDTIRRKTGLIWLNNQIYLGNGLYFQPLSAYKLANDSLFNTGYTTRAQTKRVIDSISILKVESVSNISQLQNYQGIANQIFVTDTLRGGLFYFSNASLTVDGGTIFYATGKDGGYWVRQNKSMQINVLWFGADPTGISDSKNAIQDASNAAYGKTLFFPSGTYKLNSRVQLPLINTNWQGQDSTTTITGAFDYRVVQFNAMINAQVRNIKFQTTYVNAVEDQSYAVVCSWNSDIKNVIFDQCYFTAPYANTSGLSFYTNLDTTQTQYQIDNLWITNCKYVNIGRIGTTIFNRKYINGANQCTNIHFNNNIGQNLGLNGNYGFLLSLDGTGSGGEVNGNIVINALGVGIENTGYNNFSFIGNKFKGLTRPCAPFSFSQFPMSNLIVANNQTIDTASDRCNFYGVYNSQFYGNTFISKGFAAVNLRSCGYNTFTNENYVGFRNAVYVGDNGSGNQSTNNKFYNCIFKTTDNYAVFRLAGSATTNNTATNNTFLIGGGGVYVDEILGSTGNLIYNNINGTSQGSYSSTSLSGYGVSNTGLSLISPTITTPSIVGLSNYSTNLASTYSARSMVDKNYSDSSISVNVTPKFNTTGGTMTGNLTLQPSSSSVVSILRIMANASSTGGINRPYAEIVGANGTSFRFKYSADGPYFTLAYWDGATENQNHNIDINGNEVIGSTSFPNNSIFSLVSTTKGSIPAPVMTESQRAAITSPATGMMVYVSGTGKPKYYNGSTWRTLLDSATAAATFYTGTAINSLNGLSGATQTFAVDSSGTNFNISSVGTTHTFSIPNASYSARGLMTTQDQTFQGDKYFANQNAATSSTAAIGSKIYSQGKIWNSSLGSVTMTGGIRVDQYIQNANPSVSKLSFMVGSDFATATEQGYIASNGILGSYGGADFTSTNSTNLVRIRNTTAATSGTPQNSPALNFEGRSWSTVSGSTTSKASIQLINVTNNANPPVDKLSFGIANLNGTPNETFYINTNQQFGIPSLSISGIVTNTSGGVLGTSTAPSFTQFRLSALNTAPSSASDTGTLGEVRITSTYIYVCTATNTWVRAALTTW